MATKMARARETADTLVAGLEPGADEVALYSFDTSLKEVRPFSKDFTAGRRWDETKAYGATSLWDAIAETAQQISDRQQRRALVVITDGVDSASRMKPSEVSAIASALDVPVYILVITFEPEEARKSTDAWAAGGSGGMDGRRFVGRPRRDSTLAATQQLSDRTPPSVHHCVRAGHARRAGIRSCCEHASPGSSCARAADTWCELRR